MSGKTLIVLLVMVPILGGCETLQGVGSDLSTGCSKVTEGAKTLFGGDSDQFRNLDKLSKHIKRTTEFNQFLVNTYKVQQVETEQEVATKDEKLAASNKYNTYLKKKQTAEQEHKPQASSEKAKVRQDVPMVQENDRLKKVYTAVYIDDERFIIIDPESGQPINDQVYTVKDQNVKIATSEEIKATQEQGQPAEIAQVAVNEDGSKEWTHISAVM